MLQCPYIRAQDVELFVEDEVFKFSVRPYFLRLTFPHPVIDDGRESASYDIGTGELIIRLPKKTPGQFFEDLDLLTSLLTNNKKAPRGDKLAEPKILMMQDTDEAYGSEPNDDVSEWDEPNPLFDEPSLTGFGYGFNNQYNDTTSPLHRRQRRVEVEDARFDEDRYMGDYVEDDVVCRLVAMETSYHRVWRHHHQSSARDNTEIDTLPTSPALSSSLPPSSQDITALTSRMELTSLTDSSTSLPTPASSPDRVKPSERTLTFTLEEQQTMRNLPKKQYFISDAKALYVGLVDILYAYCLDYRITEGEHTSESPVLIGKLSGSMSCLDTFTSAREVLTACYRRSLVYPLYRNFALSVSAHRDVTTLFRLGRRGILKALLSIKGLMDHDDRTYSLSRLWVDDYAVWIQTRASDKVIASLADKLSDIVIEKSDVGWNLEAYERLALELLEEYGDEDAENFPVEE
ncbi:hypothetical protein SeMB42_g00413 [Synchytrium endobioticum]|uniref:CS domain-containing protein n=1 Tax=Synchytrium endobioticum TaxID=286115 RepID=A0A507DR41_9FUNG|nr:hypothetical protein SeMB42_g00413 [Synchytrium endobioticum]